MFVVLFRNDPAAQIRMDTFGAYADADKFAYEYLSTCGERATAIILKSVDSRDAPGSREQPRLHGSVGNAAVQP